MFEKFLFEKLQYIIAIVAAVLITAFSIYRRVGIVQFVPRLIIVIIFFYLVGIIAKKLIRTIVPESADDRTGGGSDGGADDGNKI